MNSLAVWDLASILAGSGEGWGEQGVRGGSPGCGDGERGRGGRGGEIHKDREAVKIGEAAGVRAAADMMAGEVNIEDFCDSEASLLVGLIMYCNISLK